MALWMKTLLIWVVFCGMAHPATLGVAGQAQDPSQRLAEDWHPLQTIEEPAADVGAAGSADADHLARFEDHKCSACASCCAVGAMVSALLQLLAPESSTGEFVAMVQPIDAVAAAGPDRPPRGASA